MAVVSSCLEVSWLIPANERNSYLILIYIKDQLWIKKSLKVGITPSPYGSYDQGYYMCYNAFYRNLHICENMLIIKSRLSSDWRLKSVFMKEDSLVIENKNVSVNGITSSYKPPVTARNFGFSPSLYSWLTSFIFIL